MNRFLLIALFGLVLAIGLVVAFNDDDEDEAHIPSMKEAANDFESENALRYYM